MRTKTKNLLWIAVVAFVLSFAFVLAFAFTNSSVAEARTVTPQTGSRNINLQITEDGVVTWNSVAGSPDYQLTVTNGGTNTFLKETNYPYTYFNFIANFDSRKKDSGTYVISVVANGNTSYNGSLTYKYVSPYDKLDAPTGLYWDEDWAKWDAVPNATGYVVKLFMPTGGQYKEYEIDGGNTLGINFQDETYGKEGWFFSVKAVSSAKAPEKVYRDSNFTESPKKGTFNRTILSANGTGNINLKISSEGIVTWNTVDGATSYTVDVNDGSNTYFKDQAYTSTNFNFVERFDSLKRETNTYNIYVYANSDVSKNGSLITRYVSIYDKLDAPTNLVWEDKVAKWDKVTEATGYIVNLYQATGGKYQSYNVDGVDTTSYDFTDINILGEGWWFTVNAVSSATSPEKVYRNSEANESAKKKQYYRVGADTYDLTTHAAYAGGKVKIVTTEETGTFETIGYGLDAEKNSTVQMYAQPNSGYQFVSWRVTSEEGTKYSSNANITFTATQNIVLVAIFKSTAEQSESGTEANPYKVTTFAELKAKMEEDKDGWIRVDSFNNGKAYNLVPNQDYTQVHAQLLDQSDMYTLGAINIPTGREKHLIVNAKIDCRAASSKSGEYLYAFINNRGNLTITGSGTIAVSFNASLFANAIIFNQGELTVDDPVTFDARCHTLQTYGSAILNYSGEMTLNDGTYIGDKSSSLGTSDVPVAVTHRESADYHPSIITGGTFKAYYDGSTVGGYGLSMDENENLKLKGGAFYGMKSSSNSTSGRVLSANLANNCKFQKNGADFNASSLRSTNETLTVLNTNLITTVNITTTAPVQGANPAVATDSTEYTNLYAYEWKDDEGVRVSNYETFFGGEKYRLQLRVTTTKEFSRNTKVLINGKKAAFISFDSTYILCYYDFIAENIGLDIVNLGLDNPTAGWNVGAPYISSNSDLDKVEIDTFAWSPDTDKYIGGHTYYLTTRILAKTGYEFTNSTKIRVNGVNSTITYLDADSAICKVSYEIEKVISNLNNIEIQVAEPTAGFAPAEPTTDDDRFYISAYEWSPNTTFVAAEEYTLLVMVRQDDVSNTFENLTAAKINDHNATVQNAQKGYALISYTFTVPTPAYTVTYNENGGTGTMGDDANQYGGYILQDCTFTAPVGKHFVAWAENDPSGTTFNAGDEYDVQGDIIFYAVWENNAFTKQPINQAKSVDGDDKEISPEWNINFTATKYEVYKNGSLYTTVNHKWFDVSSNEATSMTFYIRAFSDETNYVQSDEFTLTWTTNVRLVLYSPGTEGSGSNELYDVASGDEVKLATYESFAFSCVGYTFSYWSVRTGSGMGPEVGQKQPGETITVTEDTYIIAVYEVKEVDHLTAEYDGNVVAGHSLDTNKMTIKLYYNDGSYVERDKNQAAFKKGTTSIDDISTYIFDTLGNIEITVTSEEVSDTMTVLVTGYTVSFNANTGSGIMNPQKDQYGTYKLPEKASFVAPDGKQFAKWAVGSVNGDKYVGGASYTVTDDVTFYAIWEDRTPQSLFATYGADVLAGNTLNGTKISITLTYSDSSKEEIAALDVTYWSDAQTQIQNPQAYVFDVIGPNSVIVKYQGLQTTMTVNVIGYAVSFDANGGEGEMFDQQNKYGAYNLPACTFVAPEGKQFKGWSLTASGDTITSCNVTGNVTVYAIWEDIPEELYTISFEANNGTGTMQPVQYAGTYTLPANGFTAPQGKQFKGWALTSDGDVIATATIVVTADTTLYAIWEDAQVEPSQIVEQDVSEQQASQGVDVKATFDNAKAGGKSVVINVGNAKVTFDTTAVNAIGGQTNVTFTMTTSNDVSDAGIDGAQLVINISINGFTAGNATVVVPFAVAVPDGKVAKVYYVNGNEKTDMNATFANGKVTFTIPHFSKYVVVFENASQPDQPSVGPAKKGLSGGAIAGIVIAIVVVLAGAGVAVFFVLKSKKSNSSKPQSEEKQDDVVDNKEESEPETTEETEDKKEE